MSETFLEEWERDGKRNFAVFVYGATRIKIYLWAKNFIFNEMNSIFNVIKAQFIHLKTAAGLSTAWEFRLKVPPTNTDKNIFLSRFFLLFLQVLLNFLPEAQVSSRTFSNLLEGSICIKTLYEWNSKLNATSFVIRIRIVGYRCFQMRFSLIILRF